MLCELAIRLGLSNFAIMISKCACEQCGEELEFDVEQAGHAIICPTCKRETPVNMLKRTKSFQFQEPEKLSPLQKCPDCGEIISRNADVCPKCGGKVATARSIFASLISLCVIGLAIWWFLFRR